jgi:hypothetical protein
MKNRTFFGCICFALIVMMLVSPAVAIVENREIPASSDPLERDSPENIAALKHHIAYIGESQEARMDGIISYISRIGGNDEAGRLREIRNDYMAAAASIPLMKTADRINDLRDDMCVQSGLFAEETQARMLISGGTQEGMREQVNIALKTFDLSLKNGTEPLWLAGERARLIVFDRESRERNFSIRNLKDQGIDTTIAEEISGRIDAKRTEMEAAVMTGGEEKIPVINTEIKSLNRQFRNTIAEYAAYRRSG